MPRERIFWLLLASLVLVGLGVGFLNNQPRTVSLALAPGAPVPEPQQARGRTWEDLELTEIVSIPAGEGNALAAPTVLRVDGSGNAFVLDSANRRIQKLSPSGQFLGSYGSPDLQNPSDFAIGPQGEVWACDPNPRNLIVFSPEGRVVRKLGFDRLVWRLSPLPGGGGFAAVVPDGEGLFQAFSGGKTRGKPFGTFFPKGLQNALTADGWLVPAGPSDFVYLFRHAGLLASYTMEGKLRFFRQTIAPVPMPKVSVDAAGGYSIDHHAPVSTLSGSVAGTNLYVLNPGDGSGPALDVYGLGRGDYQYSLRLPDKDLRYAVLTPGRLYGLSASRVTFWQISSSRTLGHGRFKPPDKEAQS